MSGRWEPVIGLELHVQLLTRSKLFSGASTAYGAPPNTQASAVDLGLPGVLPVPNAAAVRLAIRFGLAIEASIASRCLFARKNYFYPDLPKGYQISQYEDPIVSRGTVRIVLEDGTEKTVRITRAHLEEDAGKSVHEGVGEWSGIDLNRAGTPLLEVVTEPDLRSAAEAAACMRKVHELVRWLEVSDGNMQEGSFRCDANVSVRPAGSETLGTRAEIKNLNSFRFVEQAVEYEIARQIEVLEGGGRIVQETRLFDPDRGETRPLRSKEEAQDYRYFPDPDLLPVEVKAEEIEAARSAMPELPDAMRARLRRDYQLSDYDAGLLTASRELAAWFEQAAAASGQPKLAANWVTGELAAALNRSGLEITASPVSTAALGGLLARIHDGTISGKIAKEVFEAMWQGEGDADTIIERRGLRQVSDVSAIQALVDRVISENPEQVEQFRAGKEKVLGFLVGQVMKLSQGKANPQQVNELLRETLKK